MSETSGLLRIALAAITWGSIPLLVRRADASPAVIVFWRVVFEALALAAIMSARRRWREFAGLTWRTRLTLAGMGVLLALNWFLFFLGLQLADVAVAELLAYTGPVLVAVLSPMVLHERFDRRIVLPLALALGGTALVLGPHAVHLDARQLLGAAAALASALTYALLVTNAKRLIRGISTDVYMFTESLVAAAVLVPAVLLLPGPPDAVAWVSVATLGVVHTALTGMLFLSGLRVVRADRAATLTYLEPASAVVFAALLLSEPVTAATLAGGALVVAAGAVVARLAPVAVPSELPVA